MCWGVLPCLGFRILKKQLDHVYSFPYQAICGRPRVLVRVELSEAPCSILVEKQRHSAVCSIGFEGFRRPYLNGLLTLHTPATHHVCVYPEHGRWKTEKTAPLFTLSRIIPAPAYHPHRTHTASHCIVSLGHLHTACVPSLESTHPDNRSFHPKTRYYTEFRIQTPRARKTNTTGRRISRERACHRCRSIRTLRTAAIVGDFRPLVTRL